MPFPIQSVVVFVVNLVDQFQIVWECAAEDRNVLTFIVQIIIYRYKFFFIVCYFIYF